MSDKVQIKVKINGQAVSASVASGRTLADFLHEHLGLSGTKVCCGMGICKACTVAVKRPESKQLERAQACITPVAALQNSDITTVEGLAVKGGT